MTTSEKFRICNAIDIRENGDEHPAFSIQRKNIFNIWVNVKKRYYKDSYYHENPISIFKTKEEAKEAIKLMVNRIEHRTIIRKKSKIIDNSTSQCGTKLQVIKIFEERLNGKINRYFQIKIQNKFGLWRLATDKDNSYSYSSSGYVIRRERYRDIIQELKKIKEILVSNNLTKTTTRSVDI